MRPPGAGELHTVPSKEGTETHPDSAPVGTIRAFTARGASERLAQPSPPWGLHHPELNPQMSVSPVSHLQCWVGCSVGGHHSQWQMRERSKAGEAPCLQDCLVPCCPLTPTAHPWVWPRRLAIILGGSCAQGRPSSLGCGVLPGDRSSPSPARDHQHQIGPNPSSAQTLSCNYHILKPQMTG